MPDNFYARLDLLQALGRQALTSLRFAKDPTQAKKKGGLSCASPPHMTWYYPGHPFRRAFSSQSALLT
jgi:hypothetical protein